MPQTVDEIAQEISRLKGSKAPEAQAVPKTEKVKSGGYEKKGGNGGARENAGRKPGGTADQKRLRKEMVNTHYREETEVQIVDKRTGKVVTRKKPRIVAALEKLFQIGMKGQGDKDALDKWLNRAIGKPAQPIVGGDEDEEPVRVNLGVEDMLKKIYGDKEE